MIGIAEIIIFAIADFVLEFITGILTGGAAIGSIAGDSVDGMNGAVNVTALTETVSSNVTVTIIELDTGRSNQTVSEDQILEAIVPQIIELIVNGLASGLITILSASIPIPIVVEILELVISGVASALIDFLVSTILGIVTDESLGSLDTTALSIAVSDLASDLATAVNAPGKVSSKTISTILTEALPPIIEEIIVIFAQANSNEVKDILSGSNPDRRQLSSLDSHDRSLANATSVTEDQIDPAALILDFVLGILGIFFGVIVDTVLGVVGGLLPFGETLNDLILQIIEFVVFFIAGAIVDIITGIVTAGALIAGSLPLFGMSDLVKSAVQSNVATTNMTVTNITVTVDELTSSNTTLTEDQILEQILPQVIELAVSAIANALIGIIESSVMSELILQVVTGIIGFAIDPITQFLVDLILGIVGSSEAGSLNVAELESLLNELKNRLPKEQEAIVPKKLTESKLFKKAEGLLGGL